MFGPLNGSFAQRNSKGNVTSETSDGVFSSCSEHVCLSCTRLVWLADVTFNSTNAAQKKTVNMQPRQPTNDNVMNRHPQTLTRGASYPCENYETERRGLGKRTLGDPQVTMGASMIVDGSFVSSVSSDNSVEESSFRQLQDAVSQVSWVTSFLFFSFNVPWIRNSSLQQYSPFILLPQIHAAFAVFFSFFRSCLSDFSKWP